jgi:aminoglycoside phosphotransferase (APT) family kinase protein
MTDDVLRQLARLLRRYHEATEGFDGSTETWSTELADPAGSEVLCHNDVCPENVVFRDGLPRAILDFDFAAPGRRAWDVAFTAGMWAPLGDPGVCRSHPAGLDGVARAALFARSYGLHDGEEFVATVDEARMVGRRFVQGRVDAGEAAFIEMVAAHGGGERYRKNQAWWEAHREELARKVEP